jgi:hypothetical protein
LGTIEAPIERLLGVIFLLSVALSDGGCGPQATLPNTRKTNPDEQCVTI